MKRKDELVGTNYLIGIFVSALLSILIVYGFYFFKFNGDLSIKHEVWGGFGDFIGGTLNPILSFLALIALLVTIKIQTNQLFLSRRELELTKVELEKTADATQKQADHLERESIRSDIYKIIDKLSSRINENFNSENLTFVMGRSISLNSIFIHGMDLNKNLLLEQMHDDYQDDSSHTFTVIKWIESDLIRLSYYIELYEGVSKSSKTTTPFNKFYRDEFEVIVMGLFPLNMVKQEVYDFYCA